jgi:hypothetical protein
MFDQIEKLKQDYTDKYVVVDDGIAELARFAGQVGQVKTVNMSGRALVEFGARSNIGWYDIELDCLKIVPKPEPGAEQPAKHAAPPKPAKAAAAAAGEKKLSPLEMARMQGAAKRPADTPAPAAGGAKKSTADILAAARAAKGAAQSAGAVPAEKTPPAAKAKMSTADVLAAARAKKSAESQSAPPQAAASAATAPAEEAAAESTATSEAPPLEASAKKSAAAPAFPKGQKPTVSDILAWCRAHDAK